MPPDSGAKSGTGFVAKMGTESVPKVGTESVHKMRTDPILRQGQPKHFWGLARWPECEPARTLGRRPHFWYGFRPHFGDGFRPRFGYGFRPHFGYGFRTHFWTRTQSGRLKNRANFEHGSRAKNGYGAGIKYGNFNRSD